MLLGSGAEQQEGGDVYSQDRENSLGMETALMAANHEVYHKVYFVGLMGELIASHGQLPCAFTLFPIQHLNSRNLISKVCFQSDTLQFNSVLILQLSFSLTTSGSSCISLDFISLSIYSI